VQVHPAISAYRVGPRVGFAPEMAMIAATRAREMV
jgi:hypothetical protein